MRAPATSTIVLFCLSSAFGSPAAADPGTDHLEIGVRHLRSGSTFAAVRALRQAAKLGDTRAHRFLAEAYFVLNQHALFAGEIAAAKAAWPADPEPHYIEGRYLFQTKGGLEAAAEQFHQALVRDPGHAKAHCHLGIVFRSMQQTAEAEQHLGRAIESAEARKVAYYLPYQTLAALLLDLGRVDEAARHIEAAVRMAPEVGMNQFLYGKITWARSNPDAEAAIAALRATIRIDEAFLEARYLLARLLEKQGDAAGARQQLAEFKDLKDVYGAGRLR